MQLPELRHRVNTPPGNISSISKSRMLQLSHPVALLKYLIDGIKKNFFFFYTIFKNTLVTRPGSLVVTSATKEQ